MKRILNIVALVLAAIGLLWILQGLGYVGGSFMTGQTRWFKIGLVTLVVGLGLFVWNSRR
mgnify:CR=1 FL=1